MCIIVMILLGEHVADFVGRTYLRGFMQTSLNRAYTFRMRMHKRFVDNMLSKMAAAALSTSTLVPRQ